MMASPVAARIRVTTRRNAVWRECAGCGVLAPLPATKNRCSVCPAQVPVRRSGRRRAA